MSASIEDKLSSLTDSFRLVLEQRGGYRITTGDDGGGKYLILSDLDADPTEAPYRCISITGSIDGLFEDIEKFRWTFWTSDYSIYNVSELKFNAPILRILDFLEECISEEKAQ